MKVVECHKLCLQELGNKILNKNYRDKYTLEIETPDEEDSQEFIWITGKNDEDVRVDLMEDKHIEIYILIDKVSQEMINDMLSLGEYLEKEGYNVEVQKDVEEVKF